MRTDLVEANVERNRQTRGLSDSYQAHRERVMQLIEATVRDLKEDSSKKCSSVVLIGPGNCLDVDVVRLAELFETIHFVDVDAEAVQNSVNESGLSGDVGRIHAPEDIAEPLLSLTGRDLSSDAESSERLLEVLQALSSENAVADVPEADVVVSLCVLSQVLESLQRIIHQNHAMFESVVKAIRVGHLRRMLSMLRRGGVGILVSDVVSSETAPDLTITDDAELPVLVKKLVNEGNFFSGTNPSTMINDLNLLSRLPNGPETVHTIDPWRWTLNDRTYAVYAMRIQKKLPEDPDDDADAEMTES